MSKSCVQTQNSSGQPIHVYQRVYSPNDAIMLSDRSIAYMDDEVNQGWLSFNGFLADGRTPNYNYVEVITGVNDKLHITSNYLHTGGLKGTTVTGIGKYKSMCGVPKPSGDIYQDANNVLATSTVSKRFDRCIKDYVATAYANKMFQNNQEMVLGTVMGQQSKDLFFTPDNKEALMGLDIVRRIQDAFIRDNKYSIEKLISEGDIYSADEDLTGFDGIKKQLWHKAKQGESYHTIGLRIDKDMTEDDLIEIQVGGASEQYFAPCFDSEGNFDKQETYKYIAAILEMIETKKGCFPMEVECIAGDDGVITQLNILSTLRNKIVPIDSGSICVVKKSEIELNSKTNSVWKPSVKNKNTGLSVSNTVSEHILLTVIRGPIAGDIPKFYPYCENISPESAREDLREHLTDLALDEDFHSIMPTIQVHVSRTYASLLTRGEDRINPYGGRTNTRRTLAELAEDFGVGSISVRPQMEGNIWVATPRGNIVFGTNRGTMFNELSMTIGDANDYLPNGESANNVVTFIFQGCYGVAFKWFKNVATNMGGCYGEYGEPYGALDPQLKSQLFRNGNQAPNIYAANPISGGGGGCATGNCV